MQTVRSNRSWIVVGIVMLTAILHLWALTKLPVDFDEPDYLQAGYGYASAFRAGDAGAAIDYAYNREHPPLVKMLYGVGIAALGDKASWAGALYAARTISAVFGVLAVLLLALIDPVAGGLFAIHTLFIKYTSQAYLEALPLFAGLAAVLALTRAKGRFDRWFWLSAIALGVTAAGKFTYFPVVFPILYLLIFHKRPRWSELLLYGAVAVGVFFLLNPRLWHDPIARLADMLLFHVRYSHGYNVQRSGYPWYQPFLWLSRPAPWHPDVFFYGGLDGIVFGLGAVGALLERRKRLWVDVWLLGGIIVLLLWPTKWPQYVLVVVPALCLAAAAALRFLWGLARNWEDRWNWFRTIFPAPSRGFWIFSGLVVVALLGGMAFNSFRTALGRIPWSHFTTQNSPLPSNRVHVILPLASGSIAIGTDHGLAVWTAQPTTDVPDRWDVYTASNAGLPGDEVLALAEDGSGRLWAGTASGLARYDGKTWQTYRPSALGARGDRVNALAIGVSGRLWVGTEGGVAAFDGEQWQAYTAENSGLYSDYVLSLAIQDAPGGDIIWLGLMDGISRFDTASEKWTSFSTQDGRIGAGGIETLYLDSRGRLWAASLGGGLSQWDGSVWRNFRISNSDLPNDTVQTVFESEPGVLWVGTALPLTVGGTLSVYDGSTWRHYTPSNSGFSGAEPLAINKDKQNRLWVGTQTDGVEILRLDH